MKVVCIMGKSGSGKTALCMSLMEAYPNIHMVKSKTTRKERTEDLYDKESHVFCSEEDFKESESICTYHSPKGYTSWADIDCFDKDKINIYTIDPTAYLEQMIPYCKKNKIKLTGVYLCVCPNVRESRYKNRENSLSGFSEERHLNLSILNGEKNVIGIDANGTKVATLLQFVDSLGW